MKIDFVGSTSGGSGCPSVYMTDRETLVVQGTTVTDPEALATMRTHGNGIPSYESAVEVPAELLPYLDLAALRRIAFANEDRQGFEVDNAAAARLLEGRS